MEVPPSETAMLIKRLRTRGGYSLLNLAPALPIDIALLGEIDLVVANEGEAAATGSDPAQLACRPRQGLVVTRGGGAGDSPRRSENRGAGARDRAGRHHRRRRYLCRRSRGGARSGLAPGSCPAPGERRGGTSLPGPRRSDSHARRRGDCYGRRSTTPLRSRSRAFATAQYVLNSARMSI